MLTLCFSCCLFIIYLMHLCLRLILQEFFLVAFLCHALFASSSLPISYDHNNWYQNKVAIEGLTTSGAYGQIFNFYSKIQWGVL